MTMPWGKYKGYDVEEVPPSYLFWGLENFNNLSEALRATMFESMVRRIGCADLMGSAAQVEDEMPRFELDDRLLEKVFKKVSKTYHPDKLEVLREHTPFLALQEFKTELALELYDKADDNSE